MSNSGEFLNNSSFIFVIANNSYANFVYQYSDIYSDMVTKIYNLTQLQSLQRISAISNTEHDS